jgi:hypothetical protein
MEVENIQKIKKEYDFPKGELGKLYRPDAKLNLLLKK